MSIGVLFCIRGWKMKVRVFLLGILIWEVYTLTEEEFMEEWHFGIVSKIGETEEGKDSYNTDFSIITE
jgi:hypothetical protein